MSKRIIILVAAITAVTISLSAQRKLLKFKNIPYRMPVEWYGSQEAQQVADSVLKYQFPSGGWAKNNDWHLPAEGHSWEQRQEVLQHITTDGIGSTIDNEATIGEMVLLAKVYAATGKKEYRKAFIRGLDYLLGAQYANGGWPQFFPPRSIDDAGVPSYSSHITFNDNAMANVLKLLRNVYEQNAPYDAMKLPSKYQEQARDAFDRGISCILRCQIKKNGKLTVWCQQHDEHTFEPAPARAYELRSFTGSHETPTLLELLMSLPNPSDSVVASVTAAVEWLQAHVIKDMRQENFVNAEGKPDRRLVHHFGSNIWARYYDLETEEPYVCDRDGIPQPALEYIGYERRNGYGWYGNTPQEVIDAYPSWLSKVKK